MCHCSKRTFTVTMNESFGDLRVDCGQYYYHWSPICQSIAVCSSDCQITHILAKGVIHMVDAMDRIMKDIR